MNLQEQLNERLRRKLTLREDQEPEMLESDLRLRGSWKPDKNTQFLGIPDSDSYAKQETEMKYRMPEGLPTASEVGEYNKNPEDSITDKAMELMREKMAADKANAEKGADELNPRNYTSSLGSREPLLQRGLDDFLGGVGGGLDSRMHHVPQDQVAFKNTLAANRDANRNDLYKALMQMSAKAGTIGGKSAGTEITDQFFDADTKRQMNLADETTKGSLDERKMLQSHLDTLLNARALMETTKQKPEDKYGRGSSGDMLYAKDNPRDQIMLGEPPLKGFAPNTTIMPAYGKQTETLPGIPSMATANTKQGVIAYDRNGNVIDRKLGDLPPQAVGAGRTGQILPGVSGPNGEPIVRNPDGTTALVPLPGGSFSKAQELKPAESKELEASKEFIDRLDNLKALYKPEYVGGGARITEGIGGAASYLPVFGDQIAGSLIDPDRKAFLSEGGFLGDQYRSKVTGASATEREIRMLLSRLPNTAMTPEQWDKVWADVRARAEAIYQRNLATLGEKGRRIPEEYPQANKEVAGSQPKDKVRSDAQKELERRERVRKAKEELERRKAKK